MGLESLILWSLWKVATRISLVDHSPGRWEIHQLVDITSDQGCQWLSRRRFSYRSLLSTLLSTSLEGDSIMCGNCSTKPVTIFKVLHPCLSIASLALMMEEDKLANYWMEKGNTSGGKNATKSYERVFQTILHRSVETCTVQAQRESRFPSSLRGAHRLQQLHLLVAQQDERAASQVERILDPDSSSS